MTNNAEKGITKSDGQNQGFRFEKDWPVQEKPLKSHLKLKSHSPKMCKSQIRNEGHLPCEPQMLIPDELHNWLLFRALCVRRMISRNRPLGLCS
jgi:hypothetical protein